jgi:hypothetical protein
MEWNGMEWNEVHLGDLSQSGFLLNEALWDWKDSKKDSWFVDLGERALRTNLFVAALPQMLL